MSSGSTGQDCEMVMVQTLKYSATLEVLSCGECEIPFALPRDMHRAAKADGRSFWCPNGHKISYLEPENARLKRQLRDTQRNRDALSAALTHAQDQRHAAERSASAYKGQVTRIRRRVGAGVCPCCNRSFANLQRHMAGEHPGFREA